MKSPNILYSHSHDTGRYVQPYGHAVPTPNIQRLAEGGALFRQAFCANPTCSPSRASLLTGKWAHSFCTTDHGLAFLSMKCNLTDHGIGVMLIMRGPGGFTDGKVCDAMVSHIDVLPTICDLLDIARPEGVQGSSMIPLIRGEVEAINDQIFAEVN